MNCSNCGAAVPSGAMFCTNCGANMAQAAPAQHPRVPYPGKGGTRCSNCGGTVPDGYSFCPGCGQSGGGQSGGSGKCGGGQSGGRYQHTARRR